MGHYQTARPFLLLCN